MDDRVERYRKVFEASYRPLHAYARRRVGAGDADDLVGEVLATAWRRLDDIPEGRELPWLYGVARGVLANQRRGAARRRLLAVRLAGDRPTDDASSAGEGLRDALERLRPADREVLRLAAWEGLSAAEIAVALGCTENAAALRLSRARQRLRSEMTGIAGSRTQGERRVRDA